MQTKTDISKYVVNVQGKDFITFPGLLQEAHAKGLKSVNTELVNEDLTSPVIKATVTISDNGQEKTFTGYGDANANNVAKKVAGALLRMAETRAIARALRFACNIDMTAIEELDAPDENTVHHQKSAPVSRPTTAAPVTSHKPPVTTAPVASNRPTPTYQSRQPSQVIRPSTFQRAQVVAKPAQPVTTEEAPVASNNVEDVEF